MKRNDSGVTLLVLVITIVVLTIIASITVYEGKELIDKSKVQTLETNMLTIQAKAKAYAEEIEAKVWVKEGEAKETARDKAFLDKGEFKRLPFQEENLSQAHLNHLSDEIKTEGYSAYLVTGSALEKMGLNDISNEIYYVVYNQKENENENDSMLIDVIYKEGIRYNKNTYYTLSEIQNVLSN